MKACGGGDAGRGEGSGGVRNRMSGNRMWQISIADVVTRASTSDKASPAVRYIPHNDRLCTVYRNPLQTLS